MARVSRLAILAFLAVLSGGVAAQAQESAFQLVLPIACDIGRTCLVQHLVDRDPGPGARDYMCGTLTNDGHNGVDFRVPGLASMRAGVDVLTAAAFADHPVTMEEIEAGTAGLQQLTAVSPALVAFARAIGLSAGDTESMTIRGPDGAVLVKDDSAPLDRSKAQMMKFVGKRRPADGWPKGAYTATYSILREGRVVTEQTFDVTL